MRQERLQPRFVEFIPEVLEDGVLYVSMEYMTTSHKCCCGCGREVSTPLTPTDWRLSFDGKSISLEPSIGSWRLPCRSHYWITRNQVRWCEQWSPQQIEAGRTYDAMRKQEYYGTASKSAGAAPPTQTPTTQPQLPKAKLGFWSRIKSWWA